MDAVSGENYFKSLKNLYCQQRRWAWGIENFPYMMWQFKQHPSIPWLKKFKYFWNQTEGMYSWATAPLLILILGRLPFLFFNNKVSLLYHYSPVILEWLMRLAMIGLFLSVILTIFLLPPRPQTVPSYKKALMILQWVLLPFTLIVFGSFPAIDAQTRLMLGRYLGFNVTEKIRKNYLEEFTKKKTSTFK
jgi:hypothetical protein